MFAAPAVAGVEVYMDTSGGKHFKRMNVSYRLPTTWASEPAEMVISLTRRGERHSSRGSAANAPWDGPPWNTVQFLIYDQNGNVVTNRAEYDTNLAEPGGLSIHDVLSDAESAALVATVNANAHMYGDTIRGLLIGYDTADQITDDIFVNGRGADNRYNTPGRDVANQLNARDGKLADGASDTADQDGDGVPDAWDDDQDGDGTLDIYDQDWDGDGHTNAEEAANGSNPYNALDIPRVPNDDDDGDGFTNAEERAAGTDPDDPADRPQVASDDPRWVPQGTGNPRFDELLALVDAKLSRLGLNPAGWDGPAYELSIDFTDAGSSMPGNFVGQKIGLMPGDGADHLGMGSAWASFANVVRTVLGVLIIGEVFASCLRVLRQY
jgi:hypothetical protein